MYDQISAGKLFSALLFCFLFSTGNICKAQLLQWNTFGNLGTETTEPSVANDPNIAGPVNLTLGGVTAAANGNRFGGSAWWNAGNTAGGNTLAEAVAGNDYIQFIVSPNGGFSFTPTSLVFTWDRSGTGPSSVTLRSSADGFIADLGTVTGMSSGGASTTTPRTITITALTNIATATTFRLYGYGATGASGTGGFDNATSVVDVQLNGTTSAITTPTLNAGAMSAAFGGVCINTTAGPQSFSLSGTSLDGSPVSIDALPGFSYCLTSGGTYLSTLPVPYTAPTLNPTTIFVQFDPTAAISYSGNIPVNGGGTSTTTAVVGAGINTPPSTTSGAAGPIGSVSATVAGTVSSPGCGTLTDYGIEYSTTAGFPNGSGTPVASTNLAGINFTSSLTGLALSTPYYYHSYATNSNGITAYGSQGTFTTTIDIPNATAATNVANQSFDSNWDPVTGATGYRLDVATTSTFYAASTTPVVEWNFPGNPDDNIADGGIAFNASKTLNLFGCLAAVSYVPTSGSATSAATTASASGGWASGSGVDYWEVSMVTAGYYNLTASSAQRSSNTGPKDFKLQYKIGAGGSYTDVPGGTVVVGNDWTTGVLNTIALPAVCENKISVFLRWIMNTNTAVNLTTVGTGGTSAIDNITVTGNAGSFVPGYNNLSVAGVTQPVSGLTANTTYYYRLRATGASSTSDNSNVISVTTTCTPAAIGACPSDIIQCDNNVATWTDPTATGDPAATVVCSPLSGSTFSPGTTSVTCTATNGCGSPSSCSFNVTINETPVIGACPSDITQCNPVATWTDPTATGTPTATVSCSPASGSTFTVGATTPVTCTATNVCGSSSCSFNVTILSPSTDPVSASSNANYGQICIGNQVTLSVTGGTFGDGAGYVWYEGGCGAGASIGTGASITITPATTGVKNYYARIEGTCNNTNCVSVTVSVISAPPTSTVHYTASIADGCVGAPAATFSVNAAANCTFYNWTSSQPGVRFNGNPSPYQTTIPTVSVTFVSLPAAGSSGWSICAAGGNACGNTNTICTWVRAKVSAPASITGSIIGCPGVTGQAYSSSAVAGAATYQWSSTGGIVINGNGAQAVTVDFPGAFVSGTLSVRGQTACGYNGPNRTISINRAPAQPASITGPSYPCPNASSSYSVAAVLGAANYTWTTSVPGAIITGTTNSCSIAFPAVIPAGSSVSVVANSSCPFSSAARSKGIASGIPNTPAPISGPASGQCGATGVSYSITPVALATGYSWTASCGTIQGPSNLSGLTIDWPASFTSCTLTVSATNACGSGGARALFVTGAPATPVSVSGNAAPCAGSTELYTASSIGATSYNWITPPGSSILGPINGSSIILLWGSTSGNVSVQAVNSCGASGFRALACVISCRQSQITGSASGLNAEVYPNPATEKATVKFSAATATLVHLNMCNLLGQSVMTTEVAATEGTNMIDLDLNNLAKGVYMLNIMSGDNNERVRVVVE